MLKAGTSGVLSRVRSNMQVTVIGSCADSSFMGTLDQLQQALEECAGRPTAVSCYLRLPRADHARATAVPHYQAARIPIQIFVRCLAANVNHPKG